MNAEAKEELTFWVAAAVTVAYAAALYGLTWWVKRK
jgi:hypothetical protein